MGVCSRIGVPMYWQPVYYTVDHRVHVICGCKLPALAADSGQGVGISAISSWYLLTTDVVFSVVVVPGVVDLRNHSHCYLQGTQVFAPVHTIEVTTSSLLLHR
jgi:hypothetical protein